MVITESTKICMALRSLIANIEAGYVHPEKLTLKLETQNMCGVIELVFLGNPKI